MVIKMVKKLNIYSKEQTDTKLSSKQDKLVSGTNIKTINNQSLLGAGNINIGGGTSGHLKNYEVPGNNGQIKIANITNNHLIFGQTYPGSDDVKTFVVLGYSLLKDLAIDVYGANCSIEMSQDASGNYTIANIINTNTVSTKTLYITVLNFN